MDLTDAQWKLLSPLLPRPRLRDDGRGRPWRDPRDVLNGILWVLRTGAAWNDLPERYPSYQTCHRRFQYWVKIGTMERVLRARVRSRAARQDRLERAGQRARGIALIAPHRCHRTRPRTQDAGHYVATAAGGRSNGSSRGRRTSADSLPDGSVMANYPGFVQLGCIIILLRHL